MTGADFGARLVARFAATGFEPPALELLARLEVYFELLAVWNRKINLSGMSLAEPTSEALDRLLVEPVIAARHATPGAKRIIDIGSGGGSPAIPFALAVPASQLLMVESKTRKSVFLREALRALEMHDSDVVTARFEELLDRAPLLGAHDVLTVRAVRVEIDDLRLLKEFVRPRGQLLLFRRETDGRLEPPPPLEVTGRYPLVPALQSQLVVLARTS